MGGLDVNSFLDSVRGASHYAHDPGNPSWRDAPATTGVVATPDTDTKWRAVTDKLLDARNLADDWDGQGAAAPPRAAVDRALTLTQRLKTRDWPVPADCGPTVDGGVTMTWRVGKQSVAIEVTSALEIEAYRWTDGDARAVRFYV
jgi:hypothetical protein